MPEGPEIETIRRGLELGLAGQTISGVQLLWPGSFQAQRELIDRAVVGAQIKQLSRRAKVLIVQLSNDYSLLAHLKMTGQMVLVKAGGERFAGGHPTQSMRSALPDSSTRIIFELASGDRLFFNDFRKFGWIKLVKTAEIANDSLVSRLGPEILGPDFTLDYLAAQMARHRRAPLKPVIMDQAVAAGIGNIYADESLHLAQLHPRRLAGSLSPAEIKRLHESVRTIMMLAIEHGGTTFERYVNALGGSGDYLQHARVFRRQGQPCPVCGTEIEKFTLAGRGTHICPHCQPPPTAKP